MTAEKIKVMLLTGRSNKYHNWEGTSAAIREHLNAAGIFHVDTVVAPPPGGDLAGFSPKWSDYQAVVLDYDGEEWSESTKASFVEYIRNGGGLVTVHGTNNSFAYWPEFLEITGVGGWGGSGLYDPVLSPDDPSRKKSRDESWGPRVHWQGCSMVHENSPGGATHPPRHDFLVTVRDHEHPITKGLPEMWLQVNDEVYSNLRGPAKNMTILATGYADPTLRNASPYNEPLLFTIGYGEGRVLQNTLGHVGAKQDENAPAVRNVGFIVTLQRGVEWAATGKVTQAVPDDFPTAYHASLRPGPTDGWTSLLDPELSKWEIFMGVPHTTVKGLPEGTFQTEDVRKGTPLGLGNDPKGVFNTYQENGETVLYITGEIYGGLTSLEEFENFHLQTKVKWGEKKWEPRLDRRRDSGILYHCYGDHGEFWNVWKRSLEYQVQEHDMGDFITLGGTKAMARSRADGDISLYDPTAKYAEWQGYLHCPIEPDFPNGVWNTLDIYVVGNSAIHVVNGQVVLAFKDAVDHEGKPLTRGQLQIQSEAAEIYYKDLKIRPLESLPELLVHHANL